jgi:excisionase family DNA binding protein
MTRLLLRVAEAANTLAMSRASLYRLIKRGDIPVIKIGGMTRIELEQLESYVHQLSQGSAGNRYTRDPSPNRTEPPGPASVAPGPGRRSPTDR